VLRVISIVGIRPEFVQCSPVSKELRKWCEERIVHTGQHYDHEMSKLFFTQLGIPEPTYHLEVGAGSHAYQIGETLKRTEEVLLKERPNVVLVYGDSNSTLAGAVIASRLGIKVAHIEAGLRSWDRSMPEETNRILTDHCSDFFFCPTQTAANNLRREGITSYVYLVGDVTTETLRSCEQIARRSNILESLAIETQQYFLATIHRAGNTDNEESLTNVVEALLQINGTVVFPVHPRTEKRLKECGLHRRLHEKVKLIPPLGYIDFLKLLGCAKKVLTDSGGIQKEAYLLRVPCITLRENTEWVETVKEGWNTLTGVDKEKIVKMANEFEPNGTQRDIFGQGAHKRVVEVLIREMGSSC
jgi:UDP-N-acetylglucosamine 2-epimerase